MDKEITAALEYLITFFISVAAVYKGVIEIAKEKTKRVQIQAKENSLGAEALIMLREEIIELKKAKGEDNIRIEKIESIIKQMEITCEFIERRMLNMFPSQNK